MRNPARLLMLAAAGLSVASVTPAAEMYPWREHQHPFSFVFGNAIDSHQQTRLERNGDLNGYLYVRYTGVVTQDGYRVATHVNCDTVDDCSVGWTIQGKPASAKLVSHPMHDHPLFWIGRPDIPQPGGYAHFHWTGMAMPMPHLEVDGYLLELTAVNSFCFIHHGAEAAIDAATCRDNGGIKVDRGLDLSTHLNIVTSDPAGM